MVWLVWFGLVWFLVSARLGSSWLGLARLVSCCGLSRVVSSRSLLQLVLGCAVRDTKVTTEVARVCWAASRHGHSDDPHYLLVEVEFGEVLIDWEGSGKLRFLGVISWNGSVVFQINQPNQSQDQFKILNTAEKIAEVSRDKNC